VDLLKFFAFTYAISWTCFFAATSPSLVGLRGLFLAVGVAAPAIVALSLSRSLSLLRRVIEWRVGVRWYLFAVSYVAAIKLIAALLHRIAVGAWPRFGTERWYIIVAAIVISTPFQSGEEIGWRGYALPRLAARFGYAGASVILGVIWACWHLPIFFMPGADKYGQSFPLYLLQVTALSVALAWLYMNTNGSLLLVMLMHSAGNQTKDIVPSAVPEATNSFTFSSSVVAWLTVTLLWICAGYFLLRMRAQERLGLAENLRDVHPFPNGV
jgi:membrane protease YdiL (CAAX protease family)